MTAPERVKSPKIRRSVREKWTIAMMLGVPAMIVIGLVWIPTVFTVVLSFARWDGIGGTSSIEWIGTQNYVDAVQAYPPFQQALQNNVLWLVFLFLVPTVIGILLAILLDKNLKGSRLYQSIFYIPVVLSMALIGFIWQLIYSTEGGVLNSLLGTDVDWLGDPDINIWAVMVAAGWRHTGYIMLLYLAGLKAIDPSVREAAVMDGAGPIRTFFSVIFPLMKNTNLLIIVITVIEALRAFDLVWVINKGRNGLELISALVTANVVGEASRIGFGSALATIMLGISLVFIALYLAIVLRSKD
ncbi:MULTISPECIES: carbohydrate ABC transporter permease [unclassified Rhodococcus (in: high G+C Gram-positive bacteria)]|uniref:carbohydrate ABC transporter permease n=1 Tax=unclassified Rhodococcus (in: high G+C Gram-positive bacteria) TaxID=192944 RepID=UPI000B9A64CA|nr:MULTISPECIES: sugar ABC transporter permease [unclassified Rhodococcus (in: high G+C Gram-positive bacteria)]MDV7990203.1 sugar ABC transporter permease [Rhodococcus sp. IEGM 1374]OZE42206.1 ABC transporter permease [Rhodococcus sp. 05-2254-4]OZE49864.1 ABC transporter permease [Rhodococcus sp. 05-2254-3]OZE50502.1 ABC transporter permease [Rhodococcus sp. 05-2254-2]OZF49332.1 ABC transporter permease [Rhodococcus sp. 14-1411-2a]